MTAVASTGAPYCHRLRHSLTEIETTDALGGVVARFAYTLDPTGRRTREIQHGGRTTDYGHDALYRLVSETLTQSGVATRGASYQYDAVGNRTQSEIDGVTTLYSYDANDRLVSAGGTSYRYDAQGNLLSEEDGTDETRYAYDQRDRLTQAEEFSGGAAAGSVALAYDFDGNRIARTQAGITTGFVVDANRGFTQVLQETDGSGALQATYTLGGERISQHRGGAVRHYHADALGSTRLLTDAAGTETDAYAYAAFGELLSRSGTTDNPFRFTGEAFDPALGLYDLRARYYAPALGRFTQRDTFPGFEQRPLSLNEYLYADADPVNNIDPSGRFAIGLGGFGIASTARGSMAASAVGTLSFALRLARVGSIVASDARTCNGQAEDDCDDIPTIVFGGASTPQVAKHVFDAQQGLGSVPIRLDKVLVYLNRSERRVDFRREGPFSGCAPRERDNFSGIRPTCDEYPFFRTVEGGRANIFRGAVSLRFVEQVQNASQGGSFAAFLRDCDLKSHSGDPIRGAFRVEADLSGVTRWFGGDCRR